MAQVRGGAGGVFGIFGKIFHRRLSAPQPVGNGGLLDSLGDDDDARAAALEAQLERDNEAFLKATKTLLDLSGDPVLWNVWCGLVTSGVAPYDAIKRVLDGRDRIIEVPVDNVVSFPAPRPARVVHVDFDSAS